MITPKDRAAWRAANAEVEAIEIERLLLLAPTDERLWKAQNRLAKIEERTGELRCICEACGEPVFEGEPMTGGDTPLCGACAPTYADMLEAPEYFENANGEPMSAAEARALYEAHIAAGGKPTDSMAT